METVILIVAALVAFVAGVLGQRLLTNSKIGSAQRESERLVNEGRSVAGGLRREAELEHKELVSRGKLESERLLQAAEKSADQLRKTLDDERQHLAKETANVEATEKALVRREEDLDGREKNIKRTEQRITEKEAKYDRLIEQRVTELAAVAHISPEQAKEELMRHLEQEARHKAAWLITQIEDEARHEGEARAAKIMSLAMQRMASDHVSEHAISVVPLPAEEMKGRIIGREGRNIRAFEAATGIDLVIDDTPEAVVLSGFNSVRREVARIALGRLVKDGRIHPAYIEETVVKCRKELDKKMEDDGKRMIYELDIQGIHPEIVALLGRLNYRTSFGQNQLDHAKEVALLAGHMAAELGCDEAIARRAGLLHDIGKAVDQEMEGDHAGDRAQRHPLPPRDGRAEQRRVDPRRRRRRPIRRPPGCAHGGGRDPRQAARRPGAHRLGVRRGGEVLRHSSGPRDPRDRRLQQDRR
jgi:ribonuclease Y